MNRNELEEKSKPELISMAKEKGIVLTPATSKGDMIDMLLGDPLTAPQPGQGTLPREGALVTLDGGLVRSTGKTKVTINATETEKGDVFLSLNGYPLQIKRGVEVEIPSEFVGVLRDSVINTVIKDPETGRVTPMQIQRHPFTAISA